MKTKKFNEKKNKVMFDCLKIVIPAMVIFFIYLYLASKTSASSNELVHNGSILMGVARKFVEVFGGS